MVHTAHNMTAALHIDVFKGKRKWHWHVMGRNGQVVLSSQGYYSRFNAMRAAKRLAGQNGLNIRTV